MSKFVIIAVLLLVLVGGAWYFFQAQEQLIPSSQEEVVRSVTLDILERNDSGERGTAVLTEFNGGTRVEVMMEGVPSGVLQPVHFHDGECENLRAIRYPLTDMMDGSSVTELEASVDELVANLPLSINVHKSYDEPAVFVACGNVTRF